MDETHSQMAIPDGATFPEVFVGKKVADTRQGTRILAARHVELEPGPRPTLMS